MRSVSAPQLLADIVSDLRDRRLLLPAAILAAALVAVPLLLSTSAEPPAAPVSPAAAAADAGADAQPAVLTETMTVRDYRQRLGELKSTNPFESELGPPDPAAGAGALDDLLPAGSDRGSGGSGAVAIGGDSGVTPAGSSSSTATSTGGSSGPGSGGGGGGGGGEPEIRYLSHEIDVKVGQTGDLRERDGVEERTLLPKDSKPVLVFLGVNRDANRAVFLVSEDVSATSGDGACAPSGANCNFVTMREGDSRTFDYVPDGQTYKLVLKGIRTVRLARPPATKAR